jgi:histidyl-tRNA synthetase
MPHTSPLATDSFLKKAVSVASFYGFEPAEKVFGAHVQPKRSGVRLEAHHKRDPFAHAMCTLMHTCTIAGGAPKQPTFIYHLNPVDDGMHFSLSIMGVDNSIAEALLLHTATAILMEMHVKDYCVHVNSIGDADSAAKFTKEVTNYIRKHLNDMPVSFQTSFKKDVFAVLESVAQPEHPLNAHMPRPMQFLSDASRRHLREILEYLEITEIPYRINDTLIGHKDSYTQTLFEIRSSDDERVIARGGRCNELSRRFFRPLVPTAGIIMEGGKSKRTKSLPKAPSRKPRVYLIQLGFGAKLKSFPLIETLRKAHIPLYQSLGNDQLGDQLTVARELGIPYALIIGQREALEETVIVRNMETQSQQTFPIATLPAYLKQLG